MTNHQNLAETAACIDMTRLLDPVTEVAPWLLGKGLRYRHPGTGELLLAELVEVEAYDGENDPASHAFRGPTKRSWPMFEVGGMCYVYLSYGINHCMNIVTGPQDVGQAVLLRAARPLAGINTMRHNRKQSENAPMKNLLSGPGKLTQAFGIDTSLTGTRFGENGIEIVDLGIEYGQDEIRRGPRIGISKAVERPYRFGVSNSAWVSRPFEK